MVSKTLNTLICIKNCLSGLTFRDKLFTCKLSLFLKNVRFYKEKFFVSELVLNIKNYYPNFQNNDLFYLLNNVLDYTTTNYFARFKSIKIKINKYLSDLLIARLIKKLFYQNSNK